VIELNRKVLVISVALMAVAMLATLLGTVLARPFYKDISVEKASRLILSEDHPDLVVLDLRPAFMYATGHIPGAVNVPVIELTGGTPPVILHWDVLEAWIESAEGQSHLNDKIIIHCLAGLASPTGAQNLIDAGFKKVYSMEGGFDAWAAAGYPTVT
jgi:rhodanese-related sulfurtransferase